jgi:hypothetical protein
MPALCMCADVQLQATTRPVHTVAVAGLVSGAAGGTAVHSGSMFAAQGVLLLLVVCVCVCVCVCARVCMCVCVCLRCL